MRIDINMAHTRRKNLRRPQPKRHVKYICTTDLSSRINGIWYKVGSPTFSFVGGSLSQRITADNRLVPTHNIFKCRQTGDLIEAPIRVAA